MLSSYLAAKLVRKQSAFTRILMHPVTTKFRCLLTSRCDASHLPLGLNSFRLMKQSYRIVCDEAEKVSYKDDKQKAAAQDSRGLNEAENCSILDCSFNRDEDC